MEQAAAQILDTHRIMAISTVRPDGWPQTTIVGYANEGLVIYFAIFRAGQKFANIASENRVSLAVGEEPDDMSKAMAVFAGAYASEITDSLDQQHAWEVLARRHPNLAGAPIPDAAEVAMMSARCKYLSVLDYSQGLGHADALTVAGAS